MHLISTIDTVKWCAIIISIYLYINKIKKSITIKFIPLYWFYEAQLVGDQFSHIIFKAPCHNDRLV